MSDPTHPPHSGINFSVKPEKSETSLDSHDPERQTPDTPTFVSHGLPTKAADDGGQLGKDDGATATATAIASAGPGDDGDGIIYPEGGLRAWLVVLGAFLNMFAGFGLLNTVGTIQAYVSSHQLRNYSVSASSWVFGLYAFVCFFCGLQIGPIFDAKGPRLLVATGTLCLFVCMMCVGVCTEYWHFVLDFAVLGGLGSSLLFTPSVSAIAHWFKKRRGNAIGIAATGGSFGGIVFPLAFQALIPRVGWAWTTRILGFIFLASTVTGNSLVRSRLPLRDKVSIREVMPDLRIFFDGTGALALLTAGTFFMEWGLFIPVAYLTSYCLENGVDDRFSYQIIAVFNAGSCFGRWLPGYVADRWGRFNTMVISLLICLVTTFAFWLPAKQNLPLIIVFAVTFGFGSGSNISLVPPCVGQLCHTSRYGTYYATCYTLVSFSTLTGIPIGGSIFDSVRQSGSRDVLHDGGYWGTILFTGFAYTLAVICFSAVRVMKVGWALNAKW